MSINMVTISWISAESPRKSRYQGIFRLWFVSIIKLSFILGHQQTTREAVKFCIYHPEMDDGASTSQISSVWENEFQTVVSRFQEFLPSLSQRKKKRTFLLYSHQPTTPYQMLNSQWKFKITRGNATVLICFAGLKAWSLIWLSCTFRLGSLSTLKAIWEHNTSENCTTLPQ